jgi:hypothetical protein
MGEEEEGGGRANAAASAISINRGSLLTPIHNNLSFLYTLFPRLHG